MRQGKLPKEFQSRPLQRVFCSCGESTLLDWKPQEQCYRALSATWVFCIERSRPGWNCGQEGHKQLVDSEAIDLYFPALML